MAILTQPARDGAARRLLRPGAAQAVHRADARPGDPSEPVWRRLKSRCLRTSCLCIEPLEPGCTQPRLAFAKSGLRRTAPGIRSADAALSSAPLVALRARHQALRRFHRRRRPVARYQPQANSSRCSGRPAAARPRCCACWRVRDARRRAHAARRRGHRRRAAAMAAGQHDVPELRAVSASDGRGQCRVRAEAGGLAEGRDRRARRRDARAGAARGVRQAQAASACPAGSASASRLRARWPSGRRCSCSTSRSPRSTRSCATETQFELKELQERLGLTFIIVTHDQEEAMTMADRIARDACTAGSRRSARRRDLRAARLALGRGIHRRRQPARGHVSTVDSTVGGRRARPERMRGRAGRGPRRRGARVCVAIRPEKIRIERTRAGTGAMTLRGRRRSISAISAICRSTRCSSTAASC